MDCTEAKKHLLERQRGTLTDAIRAQVDAHLAGCQACRTEDLADRELSAALRDRLPLRRAPDALRRSIEERFVPAARQRAKGAGRARRWAPALAAAAVITLAAGSFGAFGWQSRQAEPMIAEAVNDHLRILYSTHPLEVESGGVHQVKPWFEGRVDFAPAVSFGGDDDFPLEGGAIAYFLDRKAAAYVYKRRLHVITLFVYRADGLPWPTGPTSAGVQLGAVRAVERTARGFHVLLWRDGDLGYSLVSDLDPHELEALGAKIAGG